MQRQVTTCDRCGCDMTRDDAQYRRTIPFAWQAGRTLSVRFVRDDCDTNPPDLCADCQTEVGRLLQQWWQGSPVALALSSRSSDEPDAVEAG